MTLRLSTTSDAWSITDLIVDRSVIGDDHDRVRSRQRRERQLDAMAHVTILANRRDERIVERDRRAVLLEQANDVERRALAHVVDVALVRDAEDEHVAAVHRLPLGVQRLRDLLDDEAPASGC